jgi:serine/threonine protein kinase
VKTLREKAPDGVRGADHEPLLVLPPRSEIGPYVASYLGVGGSSITYKADREGVLFFMKEVKDADEPARLALERECGYLQRLSHPGIVRFRDFLRQDGYSYLVVDLVPGSDLEGLVRSRKGALLPEATVLDWARQIASIFTYLHRQEPPMIYRDLKPNNLLCSDVGAIILIDFGSVRHFKKDKTKDTDAFGTVTTASPEHYGGQTDERSDIYCFGATLHYLLTNGSPNKFFFDFPEIHDSNPAVSPSFCALVRRCIQMAPADRYQTFAEVEDALKGLDGV